MSSINIGENMSVEIELKKLLLDNGFVTKKTKKGSEWTLTHEKYLVVNYHTGSRDISFNYLGKYMRDDVIKTHGTIIGLQPEKKERLSRKALSNLHFYEKIKDHLKFSLRSKGGDYVSISDAAGMEVFSEVVKFIISDSGGDYQYSEELLSKREQENYLPQKDDVNKAIELVENSEKQVTLEIILDTIESIYNNDKVILKPNWRLITERNIEIWFK